MDDYIYHDYFKYLKVYYFSLYNIVSRIIAHVNRMYHLELQGIVVISSKKRWVYLNITFCSHLLLYVQYELSTWKNKNVLLRTLCHFAFCVKKLRSIKLYIYK